MLKGDTGENLIGLLRKKIGCNYISELSLQLQFFLQDS